MADCLFGMGLLNTLDESPDILPGQLMYFKRHLVILILMWPRLNTMISENVLMQLISSGLFVQVEDV